MINFPDTPIHGTTYSYLGVQYVYKKVTGDPGFWQVSTVGSYGPALAAEIDAGTDAVKYVTPLELESSKYINDGDIATGSEIITGTDNRKYVTPLGLEASNYAKDADVAGRDLTEMYFPYSTVYTGPGTNNQNANKLVSTGLSNYKFAIVRLKHHVSVSGDEDNFYVFPYLGLYTDALPYRLGADALHKQTSPEITVPVDSSGRFYVRWTQFATEQLKIYLVGAIK